MLEGPLHRVTPQLLSMTSVLPFCLLLTSCLLTSRASEATSPDDLADLSQDEWDRDVYTGRHLDSLLLSPTGSHLVTMDTVLVLYSWECEESAIEELHYSELPPQAYLLYTRHNWEAAHRHIPYPLDSKDSLYHRYRPAHCPTALYFTQGTSILEPDVWNPQRQATFHAWIWSRFKVRLTVHNQEAGSIRVNLAGPGPSIDPVVIHAGDSAEIEGFQSYLFTVTLYQGDMLEPCFVTGRILHASDNHTVIRLDSPAARSDNNSTAVSRAPISEAGEDRASPQSQLNTNPVHSEPSGKDSDSVINTQSVVNRSSWIDTELNRTSVNDSHSGVDTEVNRTSINDSHPAVDGHQTEGGWLLAAEAAIWRQEDDIRHHQFNLAEIYLTGFKQASLLPKFTQTGVEIRTMPLGLDQALQEHYQHHTHLRYQEAISLSPLINDRFCKCGIVPLSDDLKDMVFSVLQPLAEDWCRLKLRPTAMYGVREYYTGHVVQPHVDRAATHVISVLLPVYTDLDLSEHWPLEVISHQGDRVNLTLNPGAMLLYESASVIHGRPLPLQANVYAVAYVHFQPEFDWLWSEELVGMDNKRFLVNGLNRDWMEPLFVLATEVTRKKAIDMKEEL